MPRVIKEHWINDDTVIYQTNCMYTNEGQIVIARFIPTVPFGCSAQVYDYSRMIPGTIPRVTKSAEGVEQVYLYVGLHNDLDHRIAWKLRGLAHKNKHLVPHTYNRVVHF